MKHSAAAAVFLAAALAAVLAVGPAPAADPPATPPPAKGHLPAHFKALGLTADQKDKVEAITGAAAAKVHDLEGQITAIREKEHTDYLAVLTDAQRKQLGDIATGTTTAPADKATAPPTDPKKP